jgi:hypothetical protein
MPNKVAAQGVAMDFIVFAAALGLFVLGGILIFQGFLGKEPTSRLDLDPYLRRFDGKVDNTPPPERHRFRLMLIGFALVVLSVVLLAVTM